MDDGITQLVFVILNLQKEREEAFKAEIDEIIKKYNNEKL